MVPSLLIGCSGTHWVKSNVMTGRGLVRARHGYSHSGCGSASRDSRKSKDCWSRSQKHINQLLNPRIIIYIPDQNLEAVLLTWIISSIGLTSKPSQVPQGNRILHRSWWTNTKEQLRSQSVWKSKSGYCMRYTVLGWTQFCLQNCFESWFNKVLGNIPQRLYICSPSQKFSTGIITADYIYTRFID